MKLNFDEKGQEVIDNLNARFGVKESEKVKIFTDEETAELKSALDAGGVLVTIWNDPSKRAMVTSSLVYCNEIAKLSESVSLKLYEEFDTSTPGGWTMASLSRIIEQYC